MQLPYYAVEVFRHILSASARILKVYACTNRDKTFFMFAMKIQMCTQFVMYTH